MGLLSALGRRGMRQLESGEMFGAFRPGPRRAFSSDELRALGQRPTPVSGSNEWANQSRLSGRQANPMTEMQERQAMRDALQRLQQQRMQARNQSELDEIDLDIAVLRRDLGIEPWE